MDATTGTEATLLRAAILDKLTQVLARTPERATQRDWFVASSLAVRDRVVTCWLETVQRFATKRHVHYLSMEFLIGRLFADATGNLGIEADVREALESLGLDAETLRAQEPDAALGNGGLGRLAACFMESMATLAIPAYGYGIRYEHGLFRQVIADGVQQEEPEDWLARGNPWEFERPEVAYPIGFCGTVELQGESDGQGPAIWLPSEHVIAVAYDTPVIGGGARHANTLRLWSARAAAPMNLGAFNRGDHVGALADRVRAEAISRVLYPGDESDAGQELRLRQEFFFVSASLRDLLRRHVERFGNATTLSDQAAIQLNDTHPAIGIAELMRLLVDEHAVAWDEAWRITVATFSYTNHTLLPEALETWPVGLMERLLPRHMQIIYLLNSQHLSHVRAAGGDSMDTIAAASMIEERMGRRVRMGHLAFIGSHAINGVSALHTGLMRQTVFADLDAIYPGRINNKTNGISFRRWLHRANPGLARLLADTIGPDFLHDSTRLEALRPHAEDAAFQTAFAAERRRCKQALAALIAERHGIAISPNALFDVQIKRIHEYKRQLLNILHAVAMYQAIRADPGGDWVPRVKILAGKAAPGYRVAKQVIRLAHDVAHIINTDALVGDRLKLIFLANYNVSLAETIIPAADLSEQISTAGMEASGTGNMKLALNGALTIGTLDGANVEIRDHVGADNIFIFGLTADEVAVQRRSSLAAGEAVASCPELELALRAVGSGTFSPDEPGRYRDLMRGVLDHDVFMVTQDFSSYLAAQGAVDALWRDQAGWWRAAILNTAGVGWFSADRTIAEYAAECWRLTPPAGEALHGPARG